MVLVIKLLKLMVCCCFGGGVGGGGGQLGLQDKSVFIFLFPFFLFLDSVMSFFLCCCCSSFVCALTAHSFRQFAGSQISRQTERDVLAAIYSNNSV